MNRPTLLITGGAGFLGTRLARLALSEGWTVRILDSLLAQVHGSHPVIPDWMVRECDFRRGDVRDPETVRAAVKGATSVVHLAAETGTGQSMYSVQRYVDGNVNGTAVVLDALLARESACERVVIASSRAVYGEGRYSCVACGEVFPLLRQKERLDQGIWEPPCPKCGGPIDSLPTHEQSATQPVSVYGTTKLSQELLGANISHATGMPVVVLRFQNVYGAGQSLSNPYTGILTHFFNAIRKGDAPKVFEDGRESRDFVHVGDAGAAIMQSLSKPIRGTATINVGSGERTTIQELAIAMCKAMRSARMPVVVGRYRVGDIRHCVADLSVATRLLNYAPKVRLEAGLAEFLGWAGSQPPALDVGSDANEELSAFGLLRTVRES
jgi:dTDP-L-rhamnose 4-epimerase